MRWRRCSGSIASARSTNCWNRPSRPTKATRPAGGSSGTWPINIIRFRTRASSWRASSSAGRIAAAAGRSIRSIVIASGRCNSWSQALPNARQDDDHAKVANFLRAMAADVVDRPLWARRVVAVAGQDRSRASLPDYEEGWGYYWGGRGGQTQGAPVDERRASPVFYTRAQELRSGPKRRPALAVVPEQAVEFNAAVNQRGASEVCRFPSRAVRRADDGGRRLAIRPRGDRRSQEEEQRHLRPALRWARTKRSPGWQPASSASSCRTNSTTSRSTSRWPTIAVKTNVGIWRPGEPGPDLREPPAVSQGGRLLAAG